MRLTAKQAARQRKNIDQWGRRVERIDQLLADPARSAHHDELRREREHREAQIVVWRHELEAATIDESAAVPGEMSA